MSEIFKATSNFKPNDENNNVFKATKDFIPTKSQALNDLVSTAYQPIKFGTGGRVINGTDKDFKNFAKITAERDKQINDYAENYAKEQTKGDGYESYSLKELEKLYTDKKADYDAFYVGSNDFQTAINKIGFQNVHEDDYKRVKEAYENRLAAKTIFEKCSQYNVDNIDSVIELLEKKKKTVPSKKVKEEIETEIKQIRKNTYGKGNVFKYVGKNVIAGMTAANKSFTATADFLVGNLFKAFGWKNNPISKFNEYIGDNLEYYSASAVEEGKKLGFDNVLGDLTSNVIRGSVSALPQVLLAMYTGGSSTLANVGIGGVSATNTTASTVANFLSSSAKNPLFWTSVTSELGSNYEEALANGANETEATLFATLTSTLNAFVEIGGGIETLPGNLQDAIGNKNKLWQWFKSALEEGGEEVVQSIISNINAKLVYDHNKEIASLENEDAVINPKRLSNEFITGSAVGGLLGGGQLTYTNIINAKTESQFKKIGKTVKFSNSDSISGLIDYAKKSLSPEIRGLAKSVNVDKIKDADLGRIYSYACRDIDLSVNSPKELTVVFDNFTDIVESSDNKLINGIATSRLFERLANAGIDEASANYMIDSMNVNNAKSNLDSETGAEYNYDRGEQNELFDKRTVDRSGQERAETNTRGTSESERFTEEDSVTFERRINGILGTVGQRVTRDGTTLAFVAGYINPNTESGKAYKALRSIGVKVVYCDGTVYRNDGKITTTTNEAVTTPDGTVYISSNATLHGVGIALHEIVHVSQNTNNSVYTAYESALCENIVFTSESYRNVIKLINDNNYGGKYDIDDISSWKPLMKELSAYINQYVMTDPEYAEQTFGGMFNDWNSVVTAVKKFNKDIGADSLESVSFSDKNDVQADKADTKSDSYAKDKSFWTAENSNEKSEKNSTLVSKLKALFGNEKGDSTVSVGEIVKLIEKDFGIPVSKGKFRERAYGIYKVKAEAIRTKISNALPTIGHELGHHLDKKYNLRNFQSINEAMRVLKDARPDFYNSYPSEARPGEAVAEFIRNYLADRTLAKRGYPFFYEEFERVLSERGTEDLKNLKTIGDKINEYFTAEKADRARAAVISREEARKRNAADKEVADYLEAFETNFVDEAAPLKKISKKAYDLFYYAKKADVRAHSAIVGDGVASFYGENGGLAYMRDGDGNIIKDSDEKPLNMQPLQKVLAEIDNKSMSDFEMYLVYKHGLEFLENDKRVFADDSINDKEFISNEIKRLEKAYPQFKKTAEELYSWYKSFIYEYGVKSGLLSKEQYKALNEKYPCYVPFNRNVSDGKNGVKKGVANQKAPIMRAKGSGLEILSPLESITQKVAQFMNAADRNAVMQDIANKADNVEGLGYLLEQVPPDMMPVTVSTESIKKGINEWYREQSENGNLPDDFTDTIDEIIGDTVTQFVQSNNQGRNVVWVYRKGKKTLYQVHDPNLLTALTGLNKPQFGAFTRAVGNITRLFKVLTTGGNVAWSITSNTPRDFNSAYKYSVEKNPIKFTVDYVRAVISAFSQVRGDKASDIVKLYKTVGGGYNNSLIYNSKELKTTMSELIKKDESYLKHFISRFNLIEAIEQLADFIETAPRLAEFKRVYEQTGDAQKALLAAEEITVNFNRSGSKSKVIDQYIPYFNAGIQGVNKLVSTALDSEKNKAFFAKTVVSGVITVGLLFAWNMLAMGDDDNDEYEKLSAYKKNNFYNFYIGNGKFFSIPKSKDTAVFDSTLERVFEIALKEDVDYSQEIKDYLSYLWLVFAPPLPTDAIILSTAKDLWRNEDFKGTPIVSSYYEKLEPKEQYNEKTTYIAKALGQLTGYSPMKIDHIINSNLGIIGLLNKSLGRAEKDWLLGIGTKLITDNAYSTDILNQFYDNADKYEKKANSYPDNAEAVYKNKQYSAAKSVISALNKYGKEYPDSAREIKILARDYSDSFEKNSGVDKKLLGLLERTGDKDILYDKTFSREYSIDKVKYTMDLEDYLDYVDEYYDKIEKEYDRILTMNVSDEYTAEMLKNAKEEVSDELADKYKVVK